MLKELSENFNSITTCATQGHQKENREQGIVNLFEEIMTENFPNLVKEKTHKSKNHRESQNKMDPERPTSRHVIIKMAKLKDQKRF